MQNIISSSQNSCIYRKGLHSVLKLSSLSSTQASHELQIHSKLRHPNILQFITHHFKDDNLCMQLEFMEDGDLTSLKMSKQKISENDLWNILTQLVLALSYLKSNGILHQDIKPANILRRGKRVKLADFGISKQIDDKYSCLKGTPYYLSPEAGQLESPGFQGEIWMLGCSMYQLSMGRRPFQGDSVMSLYASICKDKPMQIAGYSPEFKQTIQSMLQKNPKERITIEELMDLSQIKEQIDKLALEPDYADLLKTTLQTVKFEFRKPIDFSEPATVKGSKSVRREDRPKTRQKLFENSLQRIIQRRREQKLSKQQS